MTIFPHLASRLRRVAIAPVWRLWRDARGNMALEFALILPVLLLLLVGEYEFGEAFSISRKVTITGHTITDLIARRVSVSSSDVTTILNASAQIAAPYPSANMSIVVAALSTNSSGATTVSWSRALSGTALTTGASFSPPTGMAQPSTSLIYASVTYNYTLPFRMAWFPATLAISTTSYINPRTSSSVALTN